MNHNQTAAARRLAEQHRQAQLRIGTETVASVLAAWSLLDPTDLDATTPRWLMALSQIVANQRGRSARQAAGFLSAHRLILTGESVQVMPVEEVDPGRVATSLAVTGPIYMKQAARRNVPLARAIDVAQTHSSAAAMRHVMDGGRETIRIGGTGDRRRRGWARQLSGDACDFCQGLAAEAEAGDPAAAFITHDGCGCTPVPVY